MGQAEESARFRARYGLEHPDWFQDRVDDLTLEIRQVSIKGDRSINIVPSGVTAIVGANNVGKSLFLRELHGFLQRDPLQPDDPARRKIIEAVALETNGDLPEMFNWLLQQGSIAEISESDLGIAVTSGPIHPNTAAAYWNSRDTGSLGSLAHSLVAFQGAQERLGLVSAAEKRERPTSPATHPLHRFEDHPEELQELNFIVQEIFGEQVQLDTLGRVVELRVGRVNVPAPPVDAITRSYVDAMTGLPLAQSQGDGMRSMLGLLLALMASPARVFMIDEPEAFLHPPQAQRLGSVLGRLARLRGVQVIVSTHDRNLLAGVLSSDATVSVIRLGREGNQARTQQLALEDVGKLWADPVLRYTNVLDALFHRLVVLCEAESDCQFYASAWDALQDRGSRPQADVLFAPTNGKGAMPKIARMLRAVKVPVVCIADLDLLRQEGQIKDLVEAMGGEWSALQSLYVGVTDGVSSLESGSTCSEVLDSISASLSESLDARFDRYHRAQLSKLIGQAISPWQQVKSQGLTALPKAQQQSGDTLLSILDQIGIVLVREGTLERLAPEISVKKGPKWARRAIKSGASKGPSAQTLMRRVLASSET